MKKTVRFLSLVCVLALTLLAFSGCNSNQSNTLTVGTNSAFPPFEFQENGVVVGVDIDIMNAVADKLGMELVVRDMDFNALPNALETNQIDCIAAGFSADPDREEAMDFSDTYYYASQSILVPADSPINSAEDLKGKRIGAQAGTTGDDTATDIPDATAKPYGSPMLAVQDMQNGNLDAVIVDENPAQVLKDQYGDDLKLITDQFPEEEYVIAVKKGNTTLLNKINDALKTIMDDGTFDQIVKKYVD